MTCMSPKTPSITANTQRKPWPLHDCHQHTPATVCIIATATTSSLRQVPQVLDQVPYMIGLVKDLHLHYMHM